MWYASFITFATIPNKTLFCLLISKLLYLFYVQLNKAMSMAGPVHGNCALIRGFSFTATFLSVNFWLLCGMTYRADPEIYLRMDSPLPIVLLDHGIFVRNLRAIQFIQFLNPLRLGSDAWNMQLNAIDSNPSTETVLKLCIYVHIVILLLLLLFDLLIRHTFFYTINARAVIFVVFHLYIVAYIPNRFCGFKDSRNFSSSFFISSLFNLFYFSSLFRLFFLSSFKTGKYISISVIYFKNAAVGVPHCLLFQCLNVDEEKKNSATCTQRDKKQISMWNRNAANKKKKTIDSAEYYTDPEK